MSALVSKKESFYVLPSLISSSSDFFRKALNGNFKEKNGIVHFPAEKPKIVESYLEWLYTREVPAQTLIQQETPPPLMGRVGSTVMSFIFGAQILGLIASSLLAGRIGVRHVFAVCAALLLILIVVGRLWMEPKETPSASEAA